MLKKVVVAAFAALLLAGSAGAAETGAKGAVHRAHAIAMHGEPKYGPDFKHFAYVNPDAPKGGEMRQHFIGTFDSLNPFIIKGQPAVGLALTFETLLTPSADEAFSEYGLIAQTIEWPDDRSWVAFELRPEAKFHDGSPILADDVLFSFDALKTKGAPFYRFYYAAVAKVEKLGERKVRFSFSEGDNRELPLIIGQMPILSKKYWETRKFEETTLEAPLGSGPYKVAAFEPGRFIVYERVKGWWGENLPTSRGLNNFDSLRYDYYRDSTVALEAFKAGEYDVRLENEAKKWATGYDFPALAEGRVKKEEIKNEMPDGMQGYAFNLRRPLFQDKRVREALGYAFDFEWTNKNLFSGQYRRTESFFSNSELAAKGLPGPDELKVLEPLRAQLPPEVFTTEFKAPVTDGSGNNRDNLRKAVALLREAGWEIKEGKLVNKAGQPFAFEILLSQPTWERITLPFTKNLERLGIAASVRTVDSAQYKNREDNFDYDMVVDVWGQSLSPGNEQRDFWGSAAADSPGSRNTVGIKDKAIDQLIELVIAAPDREGLVARTRALDRALLWGHYVIPHWHTPVDRIAYWNKFGRPETVPMRGVQLNAWWSNGAVKQTTTMRQPLVIAAAQAQYPATEPGPTQPAPGAPQARSGSDPTTTVPAGQVEDPAAESSGWQSLMWIGLIAVAVIIYALRRARRPRV